MNEETLSLVRRVADVEATSEERFFLFARAEENPEIWRELAMRLDEEAHWRQAIRSPKQNTFQPENRLRGLGKTIAMITTGIAAGLLFSVTFLRPASVEPITNGQAIQAVATQDEWLKGNPRLSGLPGTGSAVQALDEAIVPAIAREKLKRLGVEVEESTVIYLVENDSGNRVAFPTRQAAFRFVNETSLPPENPLHP